MTLATGIRSVARSPLDLYASRATSQLGVRLSRDAELVRVRRGVYAERAAWDAAKPWDRYLARVHAVALTHPGAVFCLESAAALHSMPVFGQPRDIHLYDSARSSSRRFGDVVVHTTEASCDVESLDGVQMTTAAVTTEHLIRLLPPAFGLAVADAAVRAEAVSVDELRRLCNAQPSTRGVRRAAWIRSRIDARAESVGESVSRAVIEWSGFETPDLQTVFHFEGVTDRVDFFWRGCRRAGESDGLGKYRLDTTEQSQEAVIAEKRREDRLRRHLDGFARWEFADTMNPARIAAKLTQAGVPLVRPPDAVWLRTLRSNPRSF
jgi:hypothetical protein